MVTAHYGFGGGVRGGAGLTGTLNPCGGDALSCTPEQESGFGILGGVSVIPFDFRFGPQGRISLSGALSYTIIPAGLEGFGTSFSYIGGSITGAFLF